MTDEKRNTVISIIKNDTNEQLIERFLWYVDNFNPVDDDRCETYEMVKSEILNRMRTAI